MRSGTTIGDEVDSTEARQRRNRTFHLEMRRAITGGVLETSAATFLLLIAVQHFQSGATAKALLVMGGPLGLLLSPLAVSLTRKMHWKAATGAAAASWAGCAAFGVAALFGDLRVFVPACMIGVMSLTMGIPMLTQIYQEILGALVRPDEFLSPAHRSQRLLRGRDHIVFHLRRHGGICPRRVLFRHGHVQCGWSQSQLAEKVGVSRLWLSQFENGKETVELGLVLKTLRELNLGLDAGPLKSNPFAERPLKP